MNKKRELYNKLADKNYEEYLIEKWQYSTKEDFKKYLGSTSHYAYFMRYMKKNYPWIKKKDRMRCNREVLNDLNFMNYFYGAMTDAYYSVSNRAIQMEVTDLEWLQGLYKYVKPNSFLILRDRGPLIDVNGKIYDRKLLQIMVIRDIVFVQSCLDHGMVKARTKDQDACIIPDEGYEYEFIKGLMDANGTVIVDGREKREIGDIYIFSTKAQIEWLYRFLNNDGIKTHKIRCKGNFYQLSLNERYSLYKLINRMYKNDQGFSLKRKRDKCMKIKEIMEGLGNGFSK